MSRIKSIMTATLLLTFVVIANIGTVYATDDGAYWNTLYCKNNKIEMNAIIDYDLIHPYVDYRKLTVHVRNISDKDDDDDDRKVYGVGEFYVYGFEDYVVGAFRKASPRSKTIINFTGSQFEYNSFYPPYVEVVVDFYDKKTHAYKGSCSDSVDIW